MLTSSGHRLCAMHRGPMTTTSRLQADHPTDEARRRKLAPSTHCLVDACPDDDGRQGHRPQPAGHVRGRAAEERCHGGDPEQSQTAMISMPTATGSRRLDLPMPPHPLRSTATREGVGGQTRRHRRARGPPLSQAVRVRDCLPVPTADEEHRDGRRQRGQALGDTQIPIARVSTRRSINRGLQRRTRARTLCPAHSASSAAFDAASSGWAALAEVSWAQQGAVAADTIAPHRPAPGCICAAGQPTRSALRENARLRRGGPAPVTCGLRRGNPVSLDPSGGRSTMSKWT